MEEKVVGYGLLIIGIGIILISAVSVYMVFTGQSQPVKLFNLPGVSIDLQQITANNMQDQIASFLSENQKTIPPQFFEELTTTKPSPNQKQEIVPAAMINEPMNYIAHILLMGFMATIGMKIGQLGTMLIRTISVNVKEKMP